MKKFLIFGDLHVYSHKSYDIFVYLSYQILEYILDYCRKNAISDVFFLGDIFEDRETIRVEHGLKIKEHFKRFADEGIKLHAVVGNHDSVYENTTSVNSLQFYDTISEVFADNLIHKVMNIDGIGLYVFNYTENRKIDVSVVDTKKSILFTHNDIYGSVLPNGAVQTYGFPAEAFNAFDVVFNGHIHNRNERGKLIQVGSPYKWATNELNIDSGFYVVTIDNGNISYSFNSLTFMNPTLKILTIGEDVHSVDDIDFSDISGNFVMLNCKTNDMSFVNTLKNYIIQQHGAIDVFYNITPVRPEENQEEQSEATNAAQEYIQEFKTSTGFFNVIKDIIENKYDVKDSENKMKFLNKILNFK